jgi:hypothetical protein
MAGNYPPYSAQGLDVALDQRGRIEHEMGLRNANAPQRAHTEVGPVTITQREIAQAVDNLERELADLENRLELILSPPVPQVSDDGAKGSAMSPMHERMLDVLYRVQKLTRNVQSIGSRVSL